MQKSTISMNTIVKYDYLLAFNKMVQLTSFGANRGHGASFRVSVEDIGYQSMGFFREGERGTHLQGELPQLKESY